MFDYLFIFEFGKYCFPVITFVFKEVFRLFIFGVKELLGAINPKFGFMFCCWDKEILFIAFPKDNLYFVLDNYNYLNLWYLAGY